MISIHYGKHLSVYRIELPSDRAEQGMKKKKTTGTTKKSSKELREDVVEYFLNIYRLQLRAGAKAAAEAERISEISASYPDRQTYELRVEVNEEWLTRRMSIAPLGEDSGSKSTCFYVIYDDHLVIKIPPLPVTDFEKYMESIHAEQRIVDRLKPRECIVPGVSAILKRILMFEGAETLLPEQLEQRYFQWLVENPGIQKLLQINGQFVFFMDLSRYFILGDVLKRIHGGKEDKFVREITGNPGILWDSYGFEGRYGDRRREALRRTDSEVATEVGDERRYGGREWRRYGGRLRSSYRNMVSVSLRFRCGCGVDFSTISPRPDSINRKTRKRKSYLHHSPFCLHHF